MDTTYTNQVVAAQLLTHRPGAYADAKAVEGNGGLDRTLAQHLQRNCSTLGWTRNGGAVARVQCSSKGIEYTTDDGHQARLTWLQAARAVIKIEELVGTVPATNGKEATMAAKTDTTTTKNPATETLIKKLKVADATAMMEEAGYTFEGRVTRKVQLAAIDGGKIAHRQQLRKMLIEDLGLPTETPAPSEAATPKKKAKKAAAAKKAEAPAGAPAGALVGKLWVQLADRVHGVYGQAVWIEDGAVYVQQANKNQTLHQVPAKNVEAAWPAQVAQLVEDAGGGKADKLAAAVPAPQQADKAMGV